MSLLRGSVLALRVCLDLVFFPESGVSGNVTVFFTFSGALSLFSKLLRAREESCIVNADRIRAFLLFERVQHFLLETLLSTIAL